MSERMQARLAALPPGWAWDGQPPIRLTSQQRQAMRAMWQMLYDKAAALALAERQAQTAQTAQGGAA